MPGVKCESCGNSIALEMFLGVKEPVSCPSCDRKQLVELFPSFLKVYRKGEKAEPVLEAAHSSCFYHSDKAAAAVCDECGVYLCSLCDLEVENRHLCPKCLKNSKGKLKTLKTQTVLYDDIAMAVAIVSTLIIYFAVITAPFVIIFSIMKWNKVNTPYKRRVKLRFSIALALCALQLIGIICIVLLLITSAMSS